MKYLLLLLVLAVAVWMFNTRRRVRPPKSPPGAPSDASAAKPGSTAKRGSASAPSVSEMQACAHCGLHVPLAEALTDTAGRAYCGEPHRLAGPR